MFIYTLQHYPLKSKCSPESEPPWWFVLSDCFLLHYIHIKNLILIQSTLLFLVVCVQFLHKVLKKKVSFTLHLILLKSPQCNATFLLPREIIGTHISVMQYYICRWWLISVQKLKVLAGVNSRWVNEGALTVTHSVYDCEWAGVWIVISTQVRSLSPSSAHTEHDLWPTDCWQLGSVSINPLYNDEFSERRGEPLTSLWTLRGL